MKVTERKVGTQRLLECFEVILTRLARECNGKGLLFLAQHG